VKNQLIVQFRTADTPHERCYALEETLHQAFSQASDGIVDGHDIGPDRFNVFVIPNRAWGPAIERTLAFLKLKGALGEAVVAKLHGKSGRYEVVHPAGYVGGFAP
jgi:hypothetical protein